MMTATVATLRSWKSRFDDVHKRHAWVRWATDMAWFVVILGGVMAWQTRGHVRGEAPVFKAAMLDGTALSSADLRGKPAVLAFWAPWCSVCKQESPNIDTLHAQLGDSARVLSVAAGYRNLDEVRAYVEQQDVKAPVLLGGDAMAERYRVGAYPTVYFLDAEGHITGSVVGYTTVAGLLARVPR